MLSKRSKNTKIVLFATMMMAMLMVACGGKAVPSGSADYVGKDHETVKAELTEAGFTDIQEEPIDDLTSARIKEDGAVESVTIGDQSEFDAKSKFAAETKILIKYHRLPKIAFPLEEAVIQETAAPELAEKLTDAGYTNVEIEALNDLDPDETKSAFENEIQISGHEKVNPDDEIPFDASIKVIGHYPYTKYDVKLVVNYEPNLLFSKYQIDLLIDGEKVAELQNGETGEYNLRLKEGEHELTVANADDRNVNGKESLTVDADMEISYRLKSHADKIDIETEYVDKDVELALNEAKVMSNYFDLLYKPYKEVKAELESWGFTNIKLEPEYSKKKGNSFIGTVKDVTIDGEGNFKRGTVLDKTAEIVIIYYMSKDDDPARKVTVTPTPTAIATPTATATPTAEPTPTATTTPTPTATPTPETSKSVYEYAYVNKAGDYDLYYVFDTNTGIVRNFSTNDTSVSTGNFTGDFNSSVTMEFDDGAGSSWSEKFEFSGGGSKAKWIFEYGHSEASYSQIEASKAEKVLYEHCGFEETLSE